MEPLPELNNYNFRSPDVLKKSEIPKIDAHFYEATFKNEHRRNIDIDKQKDPMSIQSPTYKRRTTYLGP